MRVMRRAGWRAVAGWLTVLAGVGLMHLPAARAATVQVSIAGFAYSPNPVTINVNDTVVWTARESHHTVTADNGAFDSANGTFQTMPVGTTFTHTFRVAGRFPYYCKEHGAPGGLGMAGVVTVNAPPAAVSSLQFSAAAYNVTENGVAATIRVTRTGSSAGAVTVRYAAGNGTARNAFDYTAVAGSLAWANGDLAPKQFTVRILDDRLDEANETVLLAVGAPTGGAVLGTQRTAVLNILDNDPPPAITVNDVVLTEGNSSAATAVFTVRLSAASAQTVTVRFATANNTALQPADYAVATGTLTFLPGVLTRTVAVVVKGDLIDEPNESFFLNLGFPTNALVLDGRGVVTILDNDAPPVRDELDGEG